MSKDLVRIDTPTGEITLSPAIVRQYLVNGDGRPTDQEVMMFLALCKHQRLNPFLREAYLIKYGNNQPATIVVGKEAYLKRARSIPECRGYAAGVVCQCQETGELIRTKGLCPPGCTLVGGWATVRVAGWDEPLDVEVSLHEYVGRRKDGQITGMWASKPATMIRKVALVQALREAFPSEFGGMYSEEEMPQVENLPKEPVRIADESTAESPGPARNEVVDVQSVAGASERGGGDRPPRSQAESDKEKGADPAGDAQKQQRNAGEPPRRSRRQKFDLDPNEWDGLTQITTCGITPDQIMRIRQLTRQSQDLKALVQSVLAGIGYTQLSYLRYDEADQLIQSMEEAVAAAKDQKPQPMTGQTVQCPVRGQVDRAQCDDCATRKKYEYCPAVDGIDDEEGVE